MLARRRGRAPIGILPPRPRASARAGRHTEPPRGAAAARLLEPPYRPPHSLLATVAPYPRSTGLNRQPNAVSPPTWRFMVYAIASAAWTGALDRESTNAMPVAWRAFERKAPCCPLRQRPLHSQACLFGRIARDHAQRCPVPPPCRKLLCLSARRAAACPETLLRLRAFLAFLPL